MHLSYYTDTLTTEIYTLSLHDALPIFGIVLGVLFLLLLIAVIGLWRRVGGGLAPMGAKGTQPPPPEGPVQTPPDRKSTRLNSSHSSISYAVFCLKKKIIPWTQL